MKVLIISTYPKGTAPGQRFRYEQYLSLLEADGMTFFDRPFLSEKTWSVYYAEGKTMAKALGILSGFFRRFLLMFTVFRYDRIFVYREMAPLGPPIFEWILARVLRRKYIYDFDDAIWLPNYSASNARFHRLKFYKKVNRCMKWAWKISAGNAYLADYARQFNPNVSIIPTTIDTIHHHNLQTDYAHHPPVIGWTGTHTTMRYLDTIVPVLAELEQQFEFEFLVISNEDPNIPLRSFRYLPWKKESEIKDLATINIGIMPLEEDIWSKGKCGFKALQYMALGIPTVLSPVGVNTSIVEHGINGFHARSESEWKLYLTMLLKDAELRRQVGQAGKQTVEKHYSVRANYAVYKHLLSD